MLSKLLPVILLVIGTGGGIGAGIMLAPAPEEHADETGGADQGEHDTAHAEEPEEEQVVEKEYLKLNNQFVVPVVEKNEITSMVVISLSLEAKAGMSNQVYSMEPKLRDAFLQVLFDHANMGGFEGAFTRSDLLMPLRTALREAARRELGKGITDVLIMEIARQNV
jgi:hypothetical protein